MPQKPDFMPRFRGSDRLLAKRALITGGDSGIGRAVAVLFAREGADVAIVHMAEEADDAAETLRLIEAEGGRGLAIAGDIGVKAFCEAAVQQTVDAFGGLDILVNNASEMHEQDDIADISEDQLRRTLQTNVVGYFFMVQAALGHLHDGASIINVASVVAYAGAKNLLDYSASKGAEVAFTRSLASNLVKRGIRVNGVAPGPIWTPLNAFGASEEKLATFGEDVPLGRPGQPWEVATAFLFLASSDGSYYVGQTLHPNGGMPING